MPKPAMTSAFRLNAATRALLLDATRDLPDGTSLAQRIFVLAERARSATLAADGRIAGAVSEGGVTPSELQSALARLRLQLLSDFADAG